jgi:prephenate dehydratase
MKRIAIQGELGSFHDIAAHQYFGDEQVELICCATFEEVFENIKRDPTVIGIVAIENTIAGSLLHNYELLRQSGTTVVGEHRLHIEHSICCLPDDDWSTLLEVHSHPVALMQCGRFLANHPDLKAVEEVKELRQKKGQQFQLSLFLFMHQFCCCLIHNNALLRTWNGSS